MVNTDYLHTAFYLKVKNIIINDSCKIIYGRVMKHIFLIMSLFVVTVLGDDISQVAKKLNLFAGTKATAQWERIFSSQRRMQDYKLDSLSQDKIRELKIYLIQHAADSDQPVVPGL